MDTMSLTRPHWNGVQAVLVRKRESAGLVGWDMCLKKNGPGGELVTRFSWHRVLSGPRLQ